MNNGQGIPVVALDIDGTLGDYHSHFIQFAEGWLGETLPGPGEINNGRPLWEHLGISRAVYRECKLAYRQGGLKRTMPAYRWASELADGIAHRHLEPAEVWICTTRPYLRLDNIDPDTREWLRRNDIHYDGVIFDTLAGKYTKYAELARQVGPRVAVIMDDLPEALQGIKPDWFPNIQAILLRDQPYNQYINAWEYGWQRVQERTDIFGRVFPAIEQWRGKSGG